MARDLHNNIKTVRVIASVAGAATGKVVDRLGYESCEFVINYGTVSGVTATVVPVVVEGSVTGTLTSVADANLLGTELLASVATGTRASGTNKNMVKRVGYIGAARYVSCNILQTVTAAAPVSVTAILSNARHQPVAT